MTHTKTYLESVCEVARLIDVEAVEGVVDALASLRDRGGRLLLIGVGGSAANCSHAAADFRKVTGIQASTPTDNVAELTARINDDGWESSYANWLDSSRATADDVLMVFSVGGGDLKQGISTNLVHALQEAKRRQMKILGVVGRDGGFTKTIGDIVVVVPTVDPRFVTAHAEAFQAVLWHSMICHPKLQKRSMKWEEVTPK